MLLLGHSHQKWAAAIASRIADESPYDIDDIQILDEALKIALTKSPEVIGSLIGTGIIEEGYFDDE